MLHIATVSNALTRARMALTRLEIGNASDCIYTEMHSTLFASLIVWNE